MSRVARAAASAPGRTARRSSHRLRDDQTSWAGAAAGAHHQAEQVAEVAHLQRARAQSKPDAGTDQHIDQHPAPQDRANRVDDVLDLLHSRLSPGNSGTTRLPRLAVHRAFTILPSRSEMRKVCGAPRRGGYAHAQAADTPLVKTQRLAPERREI